jgi:hypothetical protein
MASNDVVTRYFRVTGLKPGQAIHFTDAEAREFAELDLRSGWDLPVRREDVARMVQHLELRHGLRVTEKIEGGFAAYRPETSGPGDSNG